MAYTYGLWADVMQLPAELETLRSNELGPALAQGLHTMIQRLRAATLQAMPGGRAEVLSHSTIQIGQNLVVTLLTRQGEP